MTIALVLIVLALIFWAASIAGKVPLWVSVFCLILERLVSVLPR